MSMDDYSRRLRRMREEFHAGVPLTDPGPPPPTARPPRISQYMQPLTEKNKENLHPKRLAQLDSPEELAARALRERGRTLSSSWTAPPGLGERMRGLSHVGRGGISGGDTRVVLGEVAVVTNSHAANGHSRAASRPENGVVARREEFFRHDGVGPLVPVPDQLFTEDATPRTMETVESLDTGRRTLVTVIPVRR
ncbi:hypothetical protein K440DRAFT_643345 [Wilcoxina mikolae CBS 423.85]|nr:hypothetical protein K440DRAFT_643345 [Wilcoxina mikolae CBS 423.85]